MTTSEPQKQAILEFISALGAFDTVRVSEMVGPECEFRFISDAMHPNVLDKVRMLQFLLRMKSAIPMGISFEVDQMTAEEGRVATMARGISTTILGEPYNNQYYFCHEMVDGKITKHIEFFDTAFANKIMGPALSSL